MKRKNYHVVDLKAFLERVAAKNRQTENQNNMQLVLFQEQGQAIKRPES
jgi:hypothetical protein